jgi:hypothetical protein
MSRVIVLSSHRICCALFRLNRGAKPWRTRAYLMGRCRRAEVACIKPGFAAVERQNGRDGGI